MLRHQIAQIIIATVESGKSNRTPTRQSAYAAADEIMSLVDDEQALREQFAQGSLVPSQLSLPG